MTESAYIESNLPSLLSQYGVNQATQILRDRFREDNEKYQIWKSFDDNAQRFERRYAPKLAKALNKGVQPVLESFDGRTPKTDLFDFTPTEEVLKEIYEVVGVNFGLREINAQKSNYPKLRTKAETDYRNLLVEQMLIYFNGEFRPIIQATEWHTAELLEKIGSKVFRQATEEGWGIRQTTRALDKQFQMTNRWRSRTIARTETLRAASYGDIAGARTTAEELGMRVQLEWIATFDSVARPDHMATSGQTIIDGVQKFQVGAEELRFPRDAQASAKQTVNCRCATGKKYL